MTRASDRGAPDLGEEVVATLTIRGAGKMTTAERRQIVAWLRRQADMLAKDGKNYTEGRFRARCWAAEK